MRIKTLTGHLTQTEKTAIKAILEANLKEGRVGRKDYILSKKGNIYAVRIFQTDLSLVLSGGSKKVSEHKATFILN